MEELFSRGSQSVAEVNVFSDPGLLVFWTLTYSTNRQHSRTVAAYPSDQLTAPSRPLEDVLVVLTWNL